MNAGYPNPPTHLIYSLLESSMKLQWSRPSYTGRDQSSGMMYRVTASGMIHIEAVVQNDSDVVTYSTAGLVYGNVKVTAINKCEQESKPVILSIPTAGT